tara:strand:+ start:339 stop:1493 length:1155 start_codon:yes stop_codon:yes gene_type:complete
MQKEVYKKHNSFFSFNGKSERNLKATLERISLVYSKKQGISKLSKKQIELLKKIIRELFEKDNIGKKNIFHLSDNVLDEISNQDDSDLLKYLLHRYRYEVFPQKKILDEFPPCLQIEPSSICNFRCVFCFETDKTFTDKKNGHMGRMKLDLFKNIIDQAEGNIEFVTLASRGEPLACKEIENMLDYTRGKFLNLKINTNASMLDEKKSHAILSGGVKTIVFSADAADEKLYSKLRVNGNLNQVLKNVEQFQKIREKHYSKTQIISRVSGVKFSNDQSFNDLKNFWSGLVDQVAFVDYNPWENSYEKSPNNISAPCSDLWRRMFVWWDGKTNPCDVDYKSTLSVGKFPNLNLDQLWQSEGYNDLRNKHLKKRRSSIKPCSSCALI